MIKNINLKSTQLCSLLILVLFFLLLCNESKPQNATAVLDLNTVVNPNTKLLLGITFDSRTGMLGNSGPIGYFNTNGTIVSGLETIFGDFPIYSLRYPGNGISFGFDWKRSIGLPAASRPPQNLLGPLGPSQPVIFGFDEFMAMTINRGMSPLNTQIMVPIYTTSTILDCARWNADWVEYANSVHDGSNVNGGIDWAAKRDSNGRTLPYGIKIWNIGNEPWTTQEYGQTDTGCANFLRAVTPIIDSMRAADPTIRITLPTVGNANSGWNKTIKNSSLVAQGKIYGISPHFFPNETVGGSRVSNVESVLKVLSDTMARHGLKIVLGDYAHNIPDNPTIQQENLAMQWQGANLCVDFLLLMSQISNVERVNFWIYGLSPAVYHPIRINSFGNYTLMPAAQIYKKLSNVILEKSISAASSSPTGSDGNAYAVRTGAFATASLSNVNVISVNRDLINTVPLQLSGLTGYNLTESKILTASGPTAETIIENNITADSTGKFSLTPSSVLILKYTKNSVNIVEAGIPSKFELGQNYPNPFNPTTKINFSLPLDTKVLLKVYDLTGREVSTLINGELKPAGYYSIQFNGTEFASGLYIYRIQTDKESVSKKMVLVK